MWNKNPWPTSLTWETIPFNKHMILFLGWLREKKYFLSPVFLIECSLLFKIESPLFKDDLHWIWASDSGKKNFKILSMYFCYFVIISPRKSIWPFIWTNYNSINSRKICAMFGWISLVVRQCISIFCYIFPPGNKCGPSFE